MRQVLRKSPSRGYEISEGQESKMGGNSKTLPSDDGHVCVGWLVCRLNFTLRHLDVTCEAYDHFRSCLRALEQLADGKLRFVVEPVEASFPQLLVYERIQQLVGPGPEVGR